MHGTRGRRCNFDGYSSVAGYLEFGETLEECVAREVMEETGITVKNIGYFGSQPFGLTNAIMIGFTAEWESGDIEAKNIFINKEKHFCWEIYDQER